MGKNLSNLIFCKTEQEYRAIYIREFLQKQVLTHDGKVIEFKYGHFDHIFYRNKKVAPSFDKPMAQRIMQLKDILVCAVSDIEVYENYNPQSARDERSYIYVFGKIVVILWIDPGSGKFYPITAYKKNNRELADMRKSKNIVRVK